MGWHHQLVVMAKKVYQVVPRVEANVNVFLTEKGLPMRSGVRCGGGWQ